MKSILREVYRALLPASLRHRLNVIRKWDEFTIVHKNSWAYGEDNVYTFNHAPFLQDERFLRAYALGVQTQSWHEHSIRWRCHVACWAGRHAASLAGDFVECGVNRGGLARAIVDYTDFARLDKTFFLVDTFSGLVPEYLSQSERQSGLLEAFAYYNDNSKEHVVKTFAPFPNVAVIQGAAPDVLPQITASQVAYLSLDMNCTLPELKTAEFFWGRMVAGGIILLDDYGQGLHTEQQLAFDDFARSRGVSVLALPTGQGIIFKPGLAT